jgi:hypothetical protein
MLRKVSTSLSTIVLLASILTIPASASQQVKRTVAAAAGDFLGNDHVRSAKGGRTYGSAPKQRPHIQPASSPSGGEIPWIENPAILGAGG